MVHGKPRHSQSQGSVERAKQDIQNNLMTWMSDVKSSKWSEGLKFVQLNKNLAYHDGIKRTPYKAMFGSEIKVGLKSSYLPHEVTNHLTTEEDLQEVIDNFMENDLNDEQQTSEIHTSEITLCEEHGILIDDMTCPLYSKEADIEHNRSEAKLNLEYKAIKMKQNSAAKFPECHKGDTVKVKIPEIDRGRGDFRNILLTVLDTI
ncbi:unnamed protein product [Parnassius apollo]|uniref:(apollo) hypothetical protein n=1 Tax=Parnassius apollo TaxID=110799 RepID=A0A8S3VZJ5_PARAO|nr:unnamed protein product [Parnassius apollo]